MPRALASLPGSYEAVCGNLGLRAHLAVSAADLAPVIALRLDEYATTQPYFLPEDASAAQQGDAFDPVAFTFAMYDGGQVVASARWLTELARELHLEELLTPEELATVPPGPCLQGGRLQTRPGYRKQGLSALMLYVSLRWCAENTRYRRYYGVGRSQNVQHYLQLGAAPITERPLTVSGRPGTYVAVHGDIEAGSRGLFHRLVEQGWTLSHGPIDAPADQPVVDPIEPVGPYVCRIGDEPAAVLVQRGARVLFLPVPSMLTAALVRRVYAATGGRPVDRVIVGRREPKEPVRARLSEAFPDAVVDEPDDEPPRRLGDGLVIHTLHATAGKRFALLDEISGLRWGFEP